MITVAFPYGKEFLTHSFEDFQLKAVLTSKIHDYKSALSQEALVEDALKFPIGSKPLQELAKGKHNVVIIASDHTRPVPSKIIIPAMLREIRKGNPDADITILIATGCHRGTERSELIAKFGEEIVEKEKIVVHNCDDEENLVNIGTLPSGGQCTINRIAWEADLLCAEGFIEPHFFAGFSGGRKSVLPGIAGRESVLANHCSEFIADANSRTGILNGNRIHQDMVWAARQAKLAFIVNVVINAKKEAIYAVAGDMEAAHQKGCEFLSSLCQVSAEKTDIVITTNGGYPLDQNIYQAVKGMTAAEAAVKKGGVIIMIASSSDGCGGEDFRRQLSEESDINKTLSLFLSRGRNETVPDQWQTQVFIRVLNHAQVIYISQAEDSLVRSLHMTPAHSIEEALQIAYGKLKNQNASITAIPDGVSVMVLP